jgi:hypothetical protein
MDCYSFVWVEINITSQSCWVLPALHGGGCAKLIASVVIVDDASKNITDGGYWLAARSGSAG